MVWNFATLAREGPMETMSPDPSISADQPVATAERSRDEGSGSPTRWAWLRRKLSPRRGDLSVVDVPDSEWAPPYDSGSGAAAPTPARTPEPWPPPPLPPPPKPAVDNEGSAEAPPPPARRRRASPMVAVVAVAGLLTAWYAVGTAFSSRVRTNGSPSDALNAPTQPGRGGGIITFPAPGGTGGFGSFARRATVGTIQSVNGATFTVLTGPGQTVEVTETISTAITKVVMMSVGQVKKGDLIVASGSLSAATGALAAQRITVVATGSAVAGPQSGFGAQGVAAGTVIDIVKGTLTLRAGDGTVGAVITSPSTAALTLAGASRRDFVAGQTVVVRGSPNDDGSITATAIQVGNGVVGFGGGSFGGGSFGRGPAGGGAAPNPTP